MSALNRSTSSRNSLDDGLASAASWDTDLAYKFGSVIGAETADERRGLERILSAFTGQLLPRLGTADGLVDVEEHEHSTGFASLPGGDGGVERVTLGATSGPFDAGRAARSAVAASLAAAREEAFWMAAALSAAPL